VSIAEEAGVAAGTIYWHFHSKEELFLHLIDRENDAWLQRARQVLGQDGTALERLSQVARASADSYAQSNLLLAVLRRDRQLVPVHLLEDVHTRLAKQSISLLAHLIEDGINEGSVRSVDSETMATVLFAAGHALFNQSEHGYSELADALADLATHGLALSSEAGPAKRPARRRG